MNLALFDLDNTLLPIDSDYEWGCYIQETKLVDVEDLERRNQAFLHQYQNGSLDPDAYNRFVFSLMRTIDLKHGVNTRLAAIDDFVNQRIAPTINQAARQLVQQHQKRGDLCVLTSATNVCITTPIARLFGLPVLGPIPEQDAAGILTGELKGQHNMGANKVLNAFAWLQAQGKRWDSFDAVYAYSDSENDIPLLSHANQPFATNPTPGMLQHAQKHGWKVIWLYPKT